jgi:hypothetical protein
MKMIKNKKDNYRLQKSNLVADIAVAAAAEQGVG